MVEVVGSECMIMYQAASNFFPYNQPLCFVFLSGAKHDGVGWLCLVRGQQQKSRSFASLRMTVWGGCV